jgi:hypothetical protein
MSQIENFLVHFSRGKFNLFSKWDICKERLILHLDIKYDWNMQSKHIFCLSNLKYLGVLCL